MRLNEFLGCILLAFTGGFALREYMAQEERKAEYRRREHDELDERIHKLELAALTEPAKPIEPPPAATVLPFARVG